MTGGPARRNAMLAVILGVVAACPMAPALACGWWGDGEMRRAFAEDRNGAAVTGSTTLTPELLRIPGDNGFGVSVLDAATLIPYQSLTHGRAPDRIAGFKPYGVTTVIDLGTPPAVAALHRRETEAAGMTYHSLPMADIMPTPRQTRQFADWVVGASDAPLLIYAPDRSRLAAMWVAYRLALGAPLAASLAQGRRLGLTPEQEARFRR